MPQKRCGKLYHVYPPEIIQSTSLGRLRKNHWSTMTACTLRPYQSRESENLQRTMSLVRKITFKKTVEVLFNAFKKYSNNKGTVCLKIILRTWDMILHSGVIELRIFFVTKSTIFFRSTTFVIFRLVYFLIRRQPSEGVLWRSFFRWASRKTPLQECIFTIVASLELCWKCAVLQIFFYELGQHLQKSYFNGLFPMHAKQKPVEYSPSGVH